MKLILDFLPTDLNTYIQAERSNKYIGAKIKKQDTGSVYVACKQQKLKPITERVKIHFTWYVKNKKKDPDNICFAKKCINDGLVYAGVLENDGFKQVAGFIDDFIISETEQVIVEFMEV